MRYLFKVFNKSDPKGYFVKVSANDRDDAEDLINDKFGVTKMQCYNEID